MPRSARSLGASVLLGFGVCLGALPATAAEKLPGPIPAEVLDVIDGDTVRVRAAIWLGHSVETLVRLAEVDAPERSGRCPSERAAAVLAHQRLQRLLTMRKVSLYSVEQDKYGGRVLARLVTPDGTDVSASLLAAGLVRPATDGRRPNWCGAQP